MHYYTYNISDIWAETGHLSLVEFAIYTKLRDRYLAKEEPLTKDLGALARIIQARKNLDDIANVLQEFFYETEEGWCHQGCDDTISAFREKSAKASNSAKKRWNGDNANAMRTHSERNAKAVRTQCETDAKAMLTNNHEPITNNHKPRTKNQEPKINAPAGAASAEPSRLSSGTVKKPDDVDEGVWRDWLRARGKAPLTATAWAAMCREAEKAKLSPGEAVRVCAERGWRGFRADWMDKDKEKRKTGWEPEDLRKQDYRSHDGEKFVAGSAAEYFYGKDYVRRARERYEKPYDRSQEELA